MEIFSKFWNFSSANQANNNALPITKQDDICSQSKNPIGKKPDGYKNVNSSQVKIITGKNLTQTGDN